MFSFRALIISADFYTCVPVQRMSKALNLVADTTIPVRKLLRGTNTASAGHGGRRALHVAPVYRRPDRQSGHVPSRLQMPSSERLSPHSRRHKEVSQNCSNTGQDGAWGAEGVVMISILVRIQDFSFDPGEGKTTQSSDE